MKDAEIDKLLVRDLANICLRLASADTHPKDGDVKQAPLVSGAVPKADAQPQPQPEDSK